MPRVRSLTTLLEGGSFFEGPRWHDGRWWVSDFYRGTVSAITPGGAEEVVLKVPEQPSSLGWMHSRRACPTITSDPGTAAISQGPRLACRALFRAGARRRAVGSKKRFIVIRSVVRGIGSALPRRIMKNTDFEGIVETSDE